MPIPWGTIATGLVILIVEYIIDRITRNGGEADRDEITRDVEAMLAKLQAPWAEGVMPEHLYGTPYEVVTQTKEVITKQLDARGEDYLIGEVTDLFDEILDIIKWELES